MPDVVQRIFPHGESTAVQSLNVQAALRPVREPERSQFSLLMRHFLERFFNHETASATGEGKARMVQLACAAGLPGLVVAIYLWPVYHPFRGWPPGNNSMELPSEWLQANHHFFFVLYSFVVMGLITVFQWDLFFPDLLDVFVLGTLPVSGRRLFGARVGAIALFLAGFLVDANVLALLVLPLATEPRDVFSLVMSHAEAVTLAGLFAAGFMLAAQSTLLAVLGERIFRRISLLVQGASVAILLILLLLFPVLSGVTPALLQGGRPIVYWFPPYWFLGVYEQRLAGASSLSLWTQLAHTAYAATAIVWGLAVVSYPLAHIRRVRALVQGVALRTKRRWLLALVPRMLHLTLVRSPAQRAVFHFIGQTILRVVRYRVYLVLYCGAGIALVVATVLRLDVQGGHVKTAFSADGICASLGIVPFWVLAGLRSTFASPGNQSGGWIFRAIHGRPPSEKDALDQLGGAYIWALMWAVAVTVMALCAFQLVAPFQLRSAGSFIAQALTGLSVCVLLADAFFLNITSIPFTGERPQGEENLAFTVLKCFTFFPFVTALAVGMERWMETGGSHLAIAVAGVVIAHLWMAKRHREVIRLHCAQYAVEDGEEEFILGLGLRF